MCMCPFLYILVYNYFAPFIEPWWCLSRTIARMQLKTFMKKEMISIVPYLFKKVEGWRVKWIRLLWLVSWDQVGGGDMFGFSCAPCIKNEVGRELSSVCMERQLEISEMLDDVAKHGLKPTTRVSTYEVHPLQLLYKLALHLHALYFFFLWRVYLQSVWEQTMDASTVNNFNLLAGILGFIITVVSSTVLCCRAYLPGARMKILDELLKETRTIYEKVDPDK